MLFSDQRRFVMATVRVTSGPKKLLKVYDVPPDREKIEVLFRSLLLEGCFWEVDYTGLDPKMIYELKIIDYACRSARAIVLRTKIYIDERLISVERKNKRQVDETLRMITNILEVTSGDLKIETDNILELRFRTSPNLETFDFMDQFTFATA
jgi:hypothetical protein